MSQAIPTADLRVTATNRQILAIALPISFSIFVPQINFITNNIFLGGLGEKPLAAAGITGVYYLIFGVIGFGLNNGLQAMIARRAGQQRPEAIGKLFAQGVYIAMAIAALGIICTWLLAPLVLNYSLQDPELRSTCLSFLRIRIFGLPFLYVYQMRNALLVGTNQSRLLIWGTAAETIANITLDYSLIYGRLGLPRLGFNGAAVASVIAEAIGMLVVFAVIEWKGISKQLALYKDLRPDWPEARLLLVQSSPLILQYGISILSWEFFYILIEHYGSRDLAISNTMRNILGFFGVFTWAFAATSNTMVSNIIGQGKDEEVEPLIRRIVKLSLYFSLVLITLLNIFPGSILQIYGQGESFVSMAIPVMRVVSLAMVMMSFATVWLNAVTGTGHSKVNLRIELVAIIAYTIYVYLVLRVYKLPISIAWMSEWLYWIILFLLSFFYIRSGRWKGKVI
ncbi:MATE family efflux transporter [Flavihumibacter petaseus]|uniref:Multidrug-efflux transporter n=1 Tax=Flavihumibacter petaseus NBRC 106054 TaxID=1220578 RepID=A0A0E9N458_9BACT|nr:MATE family efflux transporter [Flavihumibacter petaseus]GAO44573.1 putative MATE family transporter [Flavihumibacter petaseus NBRC 106054]